MMGQMIKQKFAFVHPAEMINDSPLDYEESNALRYTAGYVVKSLQKKIRKSAHPLKESISLCLTEMVEKNEDGKFYLVL